MGTDAGDDSLHAVREETHPRDETWLRERAARLRLRTRSSRPIGPHPAVSRVAGHALGHTFPTVTSGRSSRTTVVSNTVPSRRALYPTFRMLTTYSCAIKPVS